MHTLSLTPETIPVPVHVARDSWLMNLLNTYREGDLWERLVSAGMISRLGEYSREETKELIDLLLSGEPTEEWCQAREPVRSWAQDLTQADKDQIESMIWDEIVRYGHDLEFLVKLIDPDSPNWCAQATNWLHHRDDIANVAILLHYAGGISDSLYNALKKIDEEGTAWSHALPHFDGPEDDERLRRASLAVTNNCDGNPNWWGEPYFWDSSYTMDSARAVEALKKAYIEMMEKGIVPNILN